MAEIVNFPIQTTLSETFTLEEKDKLARLSEFTNPVSVSKTINTSGWHTIASIDTGRAFGTFTITNPESGKHDFIKFSASSVFGENKITMEHATKYNLHGVSHIRVLYSSVDRTYGGAIIQIFVLANSEITIEMSNNSAQNYNNFILVIPGLDSSPLNYEEDINAKINNVHTLQSQIYTPTLTSGWVPYDVGRTPKFHRDIHGMVFITGLVKDGIDGSVFTLPVGFRPKENLYFILHAYGSYCRGTVNALGGVNIQGSVPAYTSMSFPSFKAYI